MTTMKISASPRGRVEAGAAVLAAARTIDTRPIRARLARFERAHRAYTQAQERVDAAEAQLRSGQARLADRDVERDQAIEWSILEPRNPLAACRTFGKTAVVT